MPTKIAAAARPTPAKMIKTSDKSPKRRFEDDITDDDEYKTIPPTKISKSDLILQHIMEMKTTQTSMKLTLDDLNVSNKEFRNLIKALQTEVTTLKEKVHTLECDNERLDIELRKKNVILFGLEDEVDESNAVSKSKVEKLLSEKLQIRDVNIDTVHRLSKFTSGRTRPIRVQLLYQNDRDLILSQRSKLKSQVNSKGDCYFLNEDLPLKTRLTRKILRDKLVDALKNKSTAKIDYSRNEIVVDGKLYKVVNKSLVEQSRQSPVTTTTSNQENRTSAVFL